MYFGIIIFQAGRGYRSPWTLIRIFTTNFLLLEKMKRYIAEKLFKKISYKKIIRRKNEGMGNTGCETMPFLHTFGNIICLSKNKLKTLIFFIVCCCRPQSV